MVFINEWLPNPVGNDAQGEWVELWNSGARLVSLDGWVLKTGGGSRAALSGTIEGQAYKVFPRSKTKLVLRNTDETLALYDTKGNLIDTSHFFGSAPEGKSVSRMNYEEGAAQPLLFSIPTPGAPNATATANLFQSRFAPGTELTRPLHGTEIFAMLLASALAITALTFFVVKRNDHLSHALFGGDERVR